MALRKNQSTLSAAEKTAFVEAVLAQKQRPSLLHPGGADRTRYDDFVEVHHPIDMLDHRTIGISYDTDPVAAPPVMAPAALPVTAPESLFRSAVGPCCRCSFFRARLLYSSEPGRERRRSRARPHRR